MASNGTEKTLQFKQNSEMIENLLQCLENYKTMMCTKAKTFMQTEQHNIDLLGVRLIVPVRKKMNIFLVKRNHMKC